MNTVSALDLATLAAALGASVGRFRIEALAECDSTNSQLLSRAEAGASSGSVLIAERQTAGRGRRGRTWHSAPQDSLTFSLLWRFPSHSSAPAALSLAVGVALVRGLESLGAQGLALKWPNDLLHQERKLAGILVELQPGELRSAVIGIGLNLRLASELPADIAATACGLDTLVDVPTRELVLAALLASLAEVFDAYSAAGFAALRDDWVAHHAYQDRPVRIMSDTAQQLGICKGVDETGALLLATDDGLRQIIAGEVSLRAP